MDDNIFDEDDALDYIIYEELEKTENNNKSKGGCLTTLLFFLVPSGSIFMLYSLL